MEDMNWQKALETLTAAAKDLQRWQEQFQWVCMIRTEVLAQVAAAKATLEPLEQHRAALEQQVTTLQQRLAELEGAIAAQRQATTQQVEALRAHVEERRQALTAEQQALETEHRARLSAMQNAYQDAMGHLQATVKRLDEERQAKQAAHEQAMAGYAEAEAEAKARVEVHEARLREMVRALGGVVS